MFKIFLSFLIICSCLTVFGQHNWKLSSDNDGLKIYKSDVANSKIKAVRVECDLNANLAQTVTVLLDVKNCPDWVYSTKSCTLIKQVSPSELYYYSEVNLPWPAQNRDFVAHLTVTQNPETKVVTVDGPAVPGFVPVKKGIVRIEHSMGKWLINPLDSKHVHVSYTLQVDPGGAIPSWLVNLFATEGPTQIFKKLRLQVQKPVYKDAALSFIKE